MGSLTSIMSMIPGLSENLIPKGKEKEGQKRLKSFCCMMDSMTDEELDTNKGLEPSRIPRIARGSGTTIKEVEQLMVEHKRFAKMIGKMGKMGGKGGKGLDMAQMQRNPQAMLKNLQGAMDPRMMQQMGGQQGMMNMMKQMGNMDSTHRTAKGAGMPHALVTVYVHLLSSLALYST
jgi:signal recognition particle subunit SRP54